jgi:hypothetical protein
MLDRQYILGVKLDFVTEKNHQNWLRDNYFLSLKIATNSRQNAGMSATSLPYT